MIAMKHHSPSLKSSTEVWTQSLGNNERSELQCELDLSSTFPQCLNPRLIIIITTTTLIVIITKMSYIRREDEKVLREVMRRDSLLVLVLVGEGLYIPLVGRVLVFVDLFWWMGTYKSRFWQLIISMNTLVIDEINRPIDQSNNQQFNRNGNGRNVSYLKPSLNS